MAVLIACSECGRQLKVADSSLGKKVKCPGCAGQFVAGPQQLPEVEPLEKASRSSASGGEGDEEGRSMLKTARSTGVTDRELRMEKSGRSWLLPACGIVLALVVGAGIGMAGGVMTTLLVVPLFDQPVPASPSPSPLPPPTAGIQIEAAFYGQNISWLDVTQKVRAQAQGKMQWSTLVRTANWGEPAPGFKGPRTLLVRYSIDGESRIKSAYENEQLTLP